MPASGPSVASSRSRATLVVALLLTGAVHASDLRPLKDPAKIQDVFPKSTRLRVLNLWATWCAPCVAEMPDLRVIDETFGREVAIAGVSMDHMIPDAQQAKVAAFLDRQRITFPNVYYTGNADDLAKLFDLSGELPVTLVFDATGRELWRREGRIDREQTIAQLRELLRRTR